MYECEGIPIPGTTRRKCRIEHLNRKFKNPLELGVCGNCCSRAGELCIANPDLWESTYHPFFEGLGIPFDLSDKDAFFNSRSRVRKRKLEVIDLTQDDDDDDDEVEVEVEKICSICAEECDLTFCDDHLICKTCIMNSMTTPADFKDVKGDSFRCPMGCDKRCTIDHLAQMFTNAGAPPRRIGNLYANHQESLANNVILPQGAEAVASSISSMATIEQFRAVVLASHVRKSPCCGKVFQVASEHQCAVTHCSCGKSFCFFCLKILVRDNTTFGEDNPHSHVRTCRRNPDHGTIFGDYRKFEKDFSRSMIDELVVSFLKLVPPEKHGELQRASAGLKRELGL